jgi:sulfate adenylyltransferase
VTAPALALAGERLETLELLLSELLGPADGYRAPDDAPDGWTLIPTLRVPNALAARAMDAGELELRDTDTTPLARLIVESARPADAETSWLIGIPSPLKRPEHGIARDRRLTTQVDLSGSVVALFRGRIRPVDLLRVVDAADGRPLVLVGQGSADAAASADLAGSLRECADLVGARSFYLPSTDLTAGDVALEVLGRLGAREIRDLRQPAAPSDAGAVVLLTGLSGAGKSTIARAVTERLRATGSRRVVLLDGDHVRAELAGDLGFSAEDRDRNLQRQAWVAARVAEAGGLAICAPIAPFAATRAAMRAKVEPDAPFVVVYVSTPLAVAEQRDRKGLYAKARSGLITDFTGIDSPYEEPDDADLEIDTSQVSVSEAVDLVVSLLEEKGLMSRA